jgi:hypothetical protein
MLLLLTEFHMYLEYITLQVTNTNTWNKPSKGAFQRWFVQRMEKAPNIGTPTGQNTTQQYSKPNQSPPHKGGGHLGPLVGRPALGAAAPGTAIAPGLSLVVAWKHATSVPRVPHAKNREEHCLSPYINREPSPSTQHTQPHQALPHSIS